MLPICRVKRMFRGWTRCFRLCLIAIVFLLWLTLRPHQTRSYKGLDVWLDQQQAKKTLGVNVPYYFIKNDNPSAPSANAQLRHLSTRSRLQLSRTSRYLNISFSAPAGYHYSIEDVTTSNPNLVGYPIFSIPTKGKVPSRKTAFSVEFRCTGKEAGTALVSFRLRFQTENYDGQDIKASPLNFQIEKECEKYESVSRSMIEVCQPPCSDGGVCSSDGRCDCKEGYYGLRCSQPLCIPHCYNGGTCIKPGVCACPEGFSGKICHLASCRDNCFNHGRCIAPGKCKCYRNWFGDMCQYPVSREKSQQDKSGINMEKVKEGNSHFSSE
nr:wnt inhibitory factor 1-like [Lytechinus pictus]